MEYKHICSLRFCLTDLLCRVVLQTRLSSHSRTFEHTWHKFFYRPDALPVAQPTVSISTKGNSKHWLHPWTITHLPHPFLHHRLSDRSNATPLWNTTTKQQSFYGPLSGTTMVSRYQKKHSPNHHPDHRPIFISFFHGHLSMPVPSWSSQFSAKTFNLPFHFSTCCRNFFLHSCPRHLNFHSILPVQITCLAIFLYNLSPRPLWSTSWSGALHLIFHTCLHPISVFFSQHMPIQPLWNKAPNYLALLINFFLQQSHLWRQVTVQLLTSKPGVGQITDWTSATCHRQPAVTCLWLLKEKPLGSTGCKACRWLPKRDNLSQTTIRRLTGCWWQVAHRPWMQKVWIHIHWFKDSLHRVSQLAMSITACNFTSLLLRYTTF